MASPELKENLSDLISRRKLGGEEFSYVYIPTGEEVLGKKAVFKLLQNDCAAFDELKESCKLADDTDLSFNSKVLKLINNLPFEDERETTKKKSSPVKKTTQATKNLTKTPEKQKTILKSPVVRKELVSKMGLEKLINRRRLEGGEFTYVYLPLDKVISGKKAIYCFLKNQTEDFNKLKKSCKEQNETEEEFDARMLKQILSVPYEKEVIETTAESYTEAGSKRKIDSSASNAENKKTKSDVVGSVRNVFVEVEIFKSNEMPMQLTQIGAIEDRPSYMKKFFRPITSKKLSKLNDNVLDKLGMNRNGKTIAYKRFKSEIACTMDRQALVEFITFLQTAKDNFQNLALYTYRKESIQCLVNSLRFHGLLKRFQEIVNLMASLEEMFQQKGLWSYLPLKPISDIYLKTMGLNIHMKNPSCEDLAEFLMKTTSKLVIKHNFTLKDCTKGSNYYTEMFKMAEPCKMPENAYSIINSVTFVRREKFLDNEGSASTSKVEYKAPVKGVQLGEKSKTPTKVNKFTPVVEVMDVEEDNVLFESFSREVLYPVFCQPILVKLGTMDENTKFIKFNLNKQFAKQSKINNWEILKDSAKVFWKNDSPYAFCTLCPILANDVRYKSDRVKMIDSIPPGTVIGDYKALNKTDEEQRNLSTKVTVDLVITKSDDGPNKFAVNKEPMTVLVKLMLKPGSLTSGNLKDFIFRPSDILISQKSIIEGVNMVNKFISVDRKQAVANRAKVVIQGDGGKILTNGQILGTATLFQNDIKLLFQKLEEQEKTNSMFESSASCAILQVQHKQKRPLKTMGASRLYAQGSNPVLVRLDQYESTRLSSKFAKAVIQFSPEFDSIIDQNKKVLRILKLKEEESIVKVIWKKNIPYAFVNIKIPPVSNAMKPSIDFCDIVQNYELGSFAPLEFGEPLETFTLSMSICVDFTEKNCVVEGLPRLIKVYMKFKDAEIDKKKILEEYFAIQKVYHARIEILSIVFKPDPNEHLAPQKTATNDMKATLVVRSKDNSPVILNAREVIADCHSIDPEKNLDSFSVAGKKVVTNMPVQMNQIMDSEMDQMDMMMRNTEEQIYDPRNERRNMMRGNMGMRNMINQRNQPMQVRNPMMDFDDELDMDYIQYTDELQNMAVAMDNRFKGGNRVPGNMFQGHRETSDRRPMNQGVHSILGAGPRSGNMANESQMNRGLQRKHSNKSGSGIGNGSQGIRNPLFTEGFQSKQGGQRNSVFEKAKSKLNSGTKVTQGGSGSLIGPPRKTWSH